MEKRLENRVALVLGAGSAEAESGDSPGIGNGRASAIAYAREGARVWAIDINSERSAETRHIIEQEGGWCENRAVDVTSAQQVLELVRTVVSECGQLDILHNNVGISCFGGPVELSEEDWNRSLDCNLKSVFLSCKYVIPQMLKQGGGVITNISSILSIRVSQYDQIAYYASKAGVDHLTRAVAVKYAKQGIRANAILPGLINSPLLFANPDIAASHGGRKALIKQRNQASPTGKMGEPWDVANAAVFLALDESRYINGVVLPVDGGLICQQA